MTSAYHIWHVSPSQREDSWYWYNIDIRPQIKFIGFMGLCVRATPYLSFDIMKLCLVDECFTIVRYVANNRITLMFDLNIKITYFHNEFETGKIIFTLWHRHAKYWYIDVSPWDNMLCTFLTFVWPWPTPICGWRGFLSEFYLQFLSCFFKNILPTRLPGIDQANWV